MTQRETNKCTKWGKQFLAASHINRAKKKKKKGQLTLAANDL